MIGAAFAYARALHADFVFDDQTSVVRDPAAYDLAASTRALLPSLFSAGRDLPTRTFAGHQLGQFWSPGLEGGRGFTAWTFALNHALTGSSPLGYHVVNLALHFLVVILVFFFTRMLLERALASHATGCALAVAGAFALHPLNSQTVSYITQRSEVIASGAYLGCLMLLLRSCTRRSLASLGCLVGALFLFAIGLGTKVIIVTMPVAYWLIVWAVPDRRPGAVHARWIRHVALAIPFLVLGAWKTFALINSVKGHADAGFSVAVAGLTPWTYFMTEWKILFIYVRLIFWPAGQCLDWRYPVSTQLDAGIVLAGATLLLATVAAVLLVRRARTLAGDTAALACVSGFGVLWFFLVLAPTSSLMPLADLLVEHRTYLASLGLLAAAATLLGRLAARLPARASHAAVAVVWLALGLALFRRNAVWEEPERLWQEVARKRPSNSRAHTALATLYQGRGDLVSAIREYGLALHIVPQASREDRLAIFEGLAAALADVGHSQEAVAVARAALALKPGDTTILATLAATELRVGHIEEAERAAQAALDADPSHSQALLTLGEIHASSGDAAGAAQYFARSIEVEPNEPIRLLEYGQALAKLGRRDEACRTWANVARATDARDGDRQRAAQHLAELGCSDLRPQ